MQTLLLSVCRSDAERGRRTEPLYRLGLCVCVCVCGRQRGRGSQHCLSPLKAAAAAGTCGGEAERRTDGGSSTERKAAKMST